MVSVASVSVPNWVDSCCPYYGLGYGLIPLLLLLLLLLLLIPGVRACVHAHDSLRLRGGSIVYKCRTLAVLRISYLLAYTKVSRLIPGAANSSSGLQQHCMGASLWSEY